MRTRERNWRRDAPEPPDRVGDSLGTRMGTTHFEEARCAEYALGHLTSRWTLLGESAGSRTVGARRIEIPAGHWSTPAHEHGREEEIFYVLAGRGLSWQAGRTAEVGPGDCIVYLPRRGAHTLHALEALDVLAFGPRLADEAPRFPRLGYSLVGGRAVPSTPGAVDRAPFQFRLESELGPPELPAEPGERPPTIVNLADAPVREVHHGTVRCTRRNLGVGAGSLSTGLQHFDLPPEMESTPPHCHSVEEELFVVLAGSGRLVLGHGDDELQTPVRAGHVVCRPPSTGIAHRFQAGSEGLAFLAYGPREPSDLCFYPRSNKIGFRGLRVCARIEQVDYWDGED
jgi:uncharacterized cupin superfamily protein